MLKQYTETVIYIYIKFAVDADFQTDSVQEKKKNNSMFSIHLKVELFKTY